MRHFRLRLLVSALTTSGLLIVSTPIQAAAFQLFEQDAASVGNFHAGYAAAAYDASTSFYNPAGLTRFKKQQFVMAADNVVTSFKYRGTVAVNTLNSNQPFPVTAQGGNYALVPAFHYVAPLSDVVAFGLSVDIPFGLKTNYGKQTILRYASTVTSVQVVDISPVLAFAITDHLSIGFGPDIQLMNGEFNQVGTLGSVVSDNGNVLSSDSDGLNSANDTGYGMHAGLLYAFNESSRIGLSYHSQVVHHLTGTSRLDGPLADLFNPGVPFESSRALLSITLPPYTALSVYHQLNPSVALMGSIIYTQWGTIQNLVFQNVVGITNMEASTNVIAVLPVHFYNTFTYSVGADLVATDTITLRGGLGYDQSPMSNTYRSVQLPDNNRYVVALGGHIQATQNIGFDLSWAHIFLNKSHIVPPIQVVGDEQVTTNGSVTGGADVLAAGLVWNLN